MKTLSQEDFQAVANVKKIREIIYYEDLKVEKMLKNYFTTGYRNSVSIFLLRYYNNLLLKVDCCSISVKSRPRI